jgi:23S rRNA-/tRNA-specific pseudouridylate synthase
MPRYCLLEYKLIFQLNNGLIYGIKIEKCSIRYAAYPNYRNFMIAKTDPNDEFYFVPSGYKAPEVTVKSTGMETGTENLYVNNPRKKKSKKVREGLYGYVPVHHYVEHGPRYQTIKIKKKKVYEDYDLVITSKPEELAVKHSKQLLKSLSITY